MKMVIKILLVKRRFPSEIYIVNNVQVDREPFKRQGQILSIHTFIGKDVETKELHVPLRFCLMSRRTKADYMYVMVINENVVYKKLN